MEGGGSLNYFKQQPQGTSPAKPIYINSQQTVINPNLPAQMMSQNRQMLNYVIPTNNSKLDSKRKNAVQAGYGSMITGNNNKQWLPPNNYSGFSQALLGHMMANLPQPSSQRPQQQHQQSVSPVQFFHHPYLETGVNNNRLGTQRPNFQAPYQPMLPYDSATSRQNNKSATQRRSGTVQGKQRPAGNQENFNTIQEQVPLNLSQFGINPTPNQSTTIVYNAQQRRDLSNPRGYQKQQRMIRQNQDIRETVEAHINGTKGRSKSRRQYPTSNYPQNSLINTKTIEEYSSGMIDPTYHRAPNNSMLNDQKQIMIPEAMSNSNLSTIEQRPKKQITSVSRKKERPITTTNTNMNQFQNAYQSIPNNSKPSNLDDYLPPNNYPQGVASSIGKVNSDNELERLINEKLNQRYQSRKRQVPEQQLRAESVPKNSAAPYAAQGLPSASFTANQNKVKSFYNALQESGASSIVNQPQLHSNISLFQQQPIMNNSSLITRKSKQNNASNVLLPQNNQRNNVSVRKQLISTTQNTQKVVKTRNSNQPENTSSSHNGQGGGFNTYGEKKENYNCVVLPPNRYQQPNYDEMQGDGASQLNLEEIKSQNTLMLGFNDTSVYSNLNCKQEPQVIDSFALDQSPNVLQTHFNNNQQFYPNAAASYVLKDRQNNDSLHAGNHNQYHFKSVSKRSIEQQRVVVKDFDNDSYTQQHYHSLSPNRNLNGEGECGFIKVSDNYQSIEEGVSEIGGAAEDSSLSRIQQKRAKSTMRPSGMMHSGPKNQALIQAFGTNKTQSTDRPNNAIKVLKKPTRAQSQMRSIGRPNIQGKPLPTGKRQLGSDQQREDYLDSGQQLHQLNNNQHLSSLPSQNSSTNPKMSIAPPRNMRIRETPIRVRKGKVILRKNSGEHNTEILPSHQFQSSFGNQSAEIVALSDEQILHKKQFHMQKQKEVPAEESFVLFQKSNQSIIPGPIAVSSQFVRGRRYTLSNNNQQSDEGGSSDAPKQNRDFQSVEQDDYFDPQTTTSMINSITKAQAQFKRQFQNTGSINAGKNNNRQNLSKSIILHHNKLGSLLSTVGRYNDVLMKEIDDVDENDEDSHIQDNYGEDDDGCVNNTQTDIVNDHHAGKLINSSAAAQSEAQVARYKFPINNLPNKNYDNFASQVSGQTYDTIQIHGGQNGAGNLQNNSAHKDFSNMLNTTANKSSILLGDNLCSTSFDPNAPKLAGQSSIQRRTTTLSGSNALLSLLSQDDFTKLKQDIHNHIEKFGGQIEEKAASEEEEESGRSLRSNQKRPQRLADFKETVNHSQMSQNFSEDSSNHPSQPQQVTNGSGSGFQAPGDDDDDVVLKSFRGKKENNRQDSRANNNVTTSNKDQQLISANSVTQIEDIESSCGGRDNMIEESPRQNTKYYKTPSITEKP